MVIIRNIFIVFASVVLLQNTQISAQVQVLFTCEGENCEYFKTLLNKQNVQSKNEALDLIKNIGEKAHSAGYIAAAFDSLVINDTLTKGIFYPGPIISIASYEFSNIDEMVLKKSGVNSTRRSNVFSTIEIRKELLKIIEYYENSGFPFARIDLDSLAYKDDNVTVYFKNIPGPKVTIDTVINKGNLNVSPEILYYLTGIFPGSNYNESALRRIETLAGSHSFIREKQTAEVSFDKNKATVYVYFDKKPVNSFDGIVGFMPDYQDEGKLFLTGELMLNVTNSLMLGENIRLKWKQPQRNSQDLKTGLTIPWLIYVPLGMAWDFSLQKKDSTYVTAGNRFLLFYGTSPLSKTGAYVQYISSSLIAAQKFSQASSLPPVNDMKYSALGILSEQNTTNSLVNPSRGIKLMADLSAGKKTIIKNPVLDETIYEDIELSSLKYTAQTDLEFYLPIRGQSVLFFRNHSGIMRNPSLLLNELFQLGGLASLRGFDENRFYSSLYSVQTFEYRYLFEENSRFVLFADLAYIERDTHEDFLIQRAAGLGAGITLETGQGIFSLYFGVGKINKDAFDFKSSKIHFGYIVVF
jgi:translocation and assembly module TamA